MLWHWSLRIDNYYLKTSQANVWRKQFYKLLTERLLFCNKLKNHLHCKPQAVRFNKHDMISKAVNYSEHFLADVLTIWVDVSTGLWLICVFEGLIKQQGKVSGKWNLSKFHTSFLNVIVCSMRNNLSSFWTACSNHIRQKIVQPPWLLGWRYVS